MRGIESEIETDKSRVSVKQRSERGETPSRCELQWNKRCRCVVERDLTHSGEPVAALAGSRRFSQRNRVTHV